MTIQKLTRLLQLFNMYGINYRKEDLYLFELLLLDDEIVDMLDKPLSNKTSILKTLRESVSKLQYLEDNQTLSEVKSK